MAQVHDAWMEEGSRLLGPVIQPDPTFWDRWAAVNYLRGPFPERLEIEQQLLKDLQSSLGPELEERVWAQANRLMRRHQKLDELSNRRVAAREIARATRELLEALRLWYVEVEVATANISWEDLGTRARRAVDQLQVEHAFPGWSTWTDARW